MARSYEPISEPVPAVSTFWRNLATILKESFDYLSVVSQTVSHWLSHPRKPLMHTHLDLEARVGIEPTLLDGPLGEMRYLQNAGRGSMALPARGLLRPVQG